MVGSRNCEVDVAASLTRSRGWLVLLLVLLILFVRPLLQLNFDIAAKKLKFFILFILSFESPYQRFAFS